MKKKNDSSDLLNESADRIIKSHVYRAVGVGLIPIPFVDFVGVGWIQLNMLRSLAREYNIPFSKEVVKNLNGVLLGTAAPVSAAPYLSSMLKVIPVIGQGIGALNMSIVSGAATYAIGNIFKTYYTNGGTFTEMGKEKIRELYNQFFREGEKVASDMKEGAE